MLPTTALIAALQRAVLGPDNDQLTLSGVLMPEVTGSRLSLLALELMAEQERPGL